MRPDRPVSTGQSLHLSSTDRPSPAVRSDLRSALTVEQEQAVARRRGPLLLAAGAGSGKTSVLVERFVRAVCEDGIAPGRILAITFTERAAAELRARVRARLLELDEREAARDTEGAPIGTFHGFCARLLRIHALTAGLDPEFAILDETGAERLRRLAFRRALAALLAGERREETVDLLAAYSADRVRRMVLGVYAEQRSRGASLPALPRPDRPEPPQPEALRACALLGELLTELGCGYAELKRARSALDFDDLELCARDLLAHHEGVRRSWAERIELLMVDEFQDTNRRQLALLELLERENLFTVGDELQSIYGFRHAEVEIFRERHHRLRAEGAAIVLAHNFRSRPPLIAAVNSVFGERFGETYTPLIAAREQADQRDAAKVGEGEATRLGGSECLAASVAGECSPASVELLLTDKGMWSEGVLAGRPLARAVAGGLPPATLWRQAEARLLAQRVAELVACGQAAAGDVAVLLRAAGDIPVYERALEERGLRTLAAVGSFWGHQQVGDLLAWLRALANPLDELALHSALASPLVGLSSDGLALVARAARAGGAGVWTTIARGAEELYESLPVLDRERLKRFAEHFAAERRAAPMLGAAELLLRALALSGYERHVLSLTWGERRLANIHKLLRLARRFEAAEGRDLRGFLDHVEHRRTLSTGSEPHAPTGSGPDAVRLMTIHAAKGLEFPVVCLADLGRNGNGASPDLLVDGERIGLRLASLDGSPPVACLQYEELSEERRRSDEAEEERIVYVAMTRARERLLLSGSCDFERWPSVRAGGAPIVWLAPALAPELPALARTLERPVAEFAVAGGAARVRCWLNSPATVGEVLHEASLSPVRTAPAGSERDAVAAMHLEGSAPGTASTPPSVPASVYAPTPPPVPVPLSAPVPVPLPAPVPMSAPVPPPVPVSAAPVSAFAPKPYPLSYTALNELERCGYRYYLERVLGMPENRAAGRGERHEDGLRARARGVLVHRLLESFDFAHPRPPSPREVSAVARELGLATSPPEREEIAGLIRSAAATELAERLAAAERLRGEHPFAFTLSADEPLMSGVLDLLALEPDGGWLVVDYKSDRVAQTEDLEALVEREYGAQRLLYALAALQAQAPRVEVVHWFLERPHEWVCAHFDAAERPLLQGWLRARIELARERAFMVSETPHRGLCLTCPGRARLCSWDAADTLRERPAAESRGDC
jgi:ATP-dependent exoDNAse (exonuclease V) beta subunit